MTNNLWIIPTAYTTYLATLQITNSLYIINDKPVVAIGFIGSWLCMVLVFSLWLLLEIAFMVGRKKMEEM